MATTKDLTDRQREVLDGLRAGESADALAKRLGTSVNNIYGHRRRLRAKGIKLPGASKPKSSRAKRKTSTRQRRSAAVSAPNPNGTGNVLTAVGNTLAQTTAEIDTRLAELEAIVKDADAVLREASDESHRLSHVRSQLIETVDGIKA